MTKEEWDASKSAPEMLKALFEYDPRQFKSFQTKLHQFLLACAWKHKHLIPQRHLRNGLIGAQKWIDGEIDDDELNKLNWYAESDCFGLDYAKTEEKLAEIQEMINGIDEVKNLRFDDARLRLMRAAYFAEGAMIYQHMRKLPFIKSSFSSEFLCPDILREHVTPDFSI